MKRSNSACLAVSLLVGLFVFTGCGDDAATETPAGDTTSQADGTALELTEEEKAEIAIQFAELSEEDRALATKQGICPVGGGPLGKMGVPPKVMVPTADGEVLVFICCEGCRESLLADPETYLAKLPK